MKQKTLMWLLVLNVIFTLGAMAQKQVTGKVVDNGGLPLPGVNVMEKGTMNGTITDIDGKFKLTVQEGATLAISFIGFTAQEVAVADQSEFNITLMEDMIGLDEVVAIGYGSLKKSNVTGSVTSLELEDFNQGAINDPLSMIQGKVPGLTMTRSGDPTRGVKMSLRGPSSFRSGAGQEPLYVIDGVVGASLDLVAPESIESMEVLRDAASTAIYGARAANGVIMIKTKRGEEGAAVVNYSTYISWDKIANTIDVLSADEYRAFNQQNGLEIDDNFDGVETDWVDEVSQTGLSHNHNIGISGGNNNTTYAASVTYQDKEGVIKTSSQEKFIVRANIQQKAINNRLTLGFDVSSSVKEQNKVRGEVYLNMLRYQPTVPIKNEDGSYFQNFTKVDGTTNYLNPVGLLNNNVNRVKTKTLFTAINAKYNLYKGLDYSINLSYQNRQINDNEYFGVNSAINKYRTLNGTAIRKAKENEQKLLESFLTYDFQIDDHDIKLLGGYSWQENIDDNGFARVAAGFSNDNVLYYNQNFASATTAISTPGVSLVTLRMISYFGRVNYSYQGKYLMQASIRRDGSSAFGVDNKWGNHPAFSLGWRITEESFMKSQNLINNLKLRVGYGVSGNSRGFNPLTNLVRFTNPGKYPTYFIDGENVVVTDQTQNYNQNIEWETTNMLNLGLDFAILDGKINGSVEWYNKKTENLIFNTSVDPSSGYMDDKVWANVGEMENKGFEVSLNATPVRTNDVKWSTSFNASFNRNELTSLSQNQYSTDSLRYTEVGGRGQSGDESQIYKVGKAYGTFFTRKYAGKSSTGASLYYRQDGTITTGIDDAGEAGVFYLGNPQPKATLGWQNTITYKNWSLNFFFRGVFGNKILNATLAQLNMVGGASHRFNFPKYGLGDSVNDSNSDLISSRYIEDGDFIRLDNLTLSYQFKLNNDLIKSLKVYSTINNVFTITDYEGIDPEIDIIGDKPGVDDENYYPFTRTFLLGLNLTF